MTFQTVCDDWMDDLTMNVDGLGDAVRHLYTPWAVELGLASSGERHVAIWPEGDPDVVNHAIAASPPSDLAEQSYLIMVWEDASVDSSRMQDDEDAAATWLTLFEDIRARLYLLSNAQNGNVDTTAYAGGAFDLRAGVRIMQLRFKTRVFFPYS